MSIKDNSIPTKAQILFWSFGLGLAVFLGIMGLRTVNTLLTESDDGLRRARVPICVEYDYDKSGESCMGYEYQYMDMGKRIMGHMKSSFVFGFAIFAFMYLYLRKERLQSLARYAPYKSPDTVKSQTKSSKKETKELIKRANKVFGN